MYKDKEVNKNVKNTFFINVWRKEFFTFTSLNLVLFWQLFYLFCSSIVINSEVNVKNSLRHTLIKKVFLTFLLTSLSLYIFTIWKSIVYYRLCRHGIYFDKILVSEYKLFKRSNKTWKCYVVHVSTIWMWYILMLSWLIVWNIKIAFICIWCLHLAIDSLCKGQ
jgi:hypothetical protein